MDRTIRFKDLDVWGCVNPGTRVADTQGNQFVVEKQNDAGFLPLYTLLGAVTAPSKPLIRLTTMSIQNCRNVGPSDLNSDEDPTASLVHRTIIIDGETCEYDSAKRPVVRHKVTSHLAVYLQLGGGRYIRVQPIKKTGQVSTRKAYWSQSTDWEVVGEIAWCTAFRRKAVPRTWLGKMLFDFLCDPVELTHHWTEDIKIWQGKRIPAGLWWRYCDVQANKSETQHG